MAHPIVLVLGEPNFRSMADVDTPSGFNSALESTELSSQAEASSNTSDILSSTVRDGAVAPPEEEVEISVIENIEVLFCSKCEKILQS